MSAGEDVEKLETSDTLLVRMQNDAATVEKFGSSSKS